jgi:hypothetical protein
MFCDLKNDSDGKDSRKPFPKKLLDVVENLYKAFPEEEYPFTIDYCNCGCQSGQVSVYQRLESTPRRYVNKDDLDSYTSSVFSTVCESEFQHFLPRILELSLERYFTDPELIFIKIWYREEMNLWDPNSSKYKAVIHFYTTAWSYVLENHSFQIGPWLCFLAILNVHIESYLVELINARSYYPYCSLADLIQEIAEYKKISPYFEDDEINLTSFFNQILPWLRQPAILETLNTILSEDPQADYKIPLTEAITALKPLLNKN